MARSSSANQRLIHRLHVGENNGKERHVPRESTVTDERVWYCGRMDSNNLFFSSFFAVMLSLHYCSKVWNHLEMSLILKKNFLSISEP